MPGTIPITLLRLPDELKNELVELVKKDLIKWSVPKEIEFREKLPLTKIGKVDFKVLEEEERRKSGG